MSDCSHLYKIAVLSVNGDFTYLEGGASKSAIKERHDI